jgi:hypothetical protein
MNTRWEKDVEIMYLALQQLRDFEGDVMEVEVAHTSIRDVVMIWREMIK